MSLVLHIILLDASTSPPLSVPLQWVISVPVFLEGILLLCFCCCCFVLNTSLFPCGKFGLPYPGKATAATRAALPIPISMSVFLCVQIMPVWGIFNMRAHVGACNCIWWLCKLLKLLIEESLHWKLTLGKNPILHWGIEPASVSHQTFQSGTLVTPMIVSVQVLVQSRSINYSHFLHIFILLCLICCNYFTLILCHNFDSTLHSYCTI